MITCADGQRVFTDLLKASCDLATVRFQQHLDILEDQGVQYMPILERLELLKAYGTLRLAVGRHIGQTTACLEFIKSVYPDCRTLYLCPHADQLKAANAKSCTNTVFCTWNQTGHQDPRGVRAIFVDPGPHAGPAARESIYQCAAEAMVTPDRSMTPVLIYFIGT